MRPQQADALRVDQIHRKPQGISLLWTHPIGLKLLYTAIVMNVLGALAIRKIVRIRV